jgi:hypothetical protein
VKLVHMLSTGLSEPNLTKCELWDDAGKWLELVSIHTPVPGATVSCLRCLYWASVVPTLTVFVPGVILDEFSDEP